MTDGSDESSGARIASYRKLAGYTQREFAEHAHLSLGSVRKVERGERLPTYGFLHTAARTLAVSVEELTGQPYRGQCRADERVHAPVAAIRTVARAYDLPSACRTGSRPLEEIAADVGAATRHRAAARYTRLGLALPALLEELTAAVHRLDGEEKRRAAKLLASCYYMAHCLAYRLGYADLASLLEDRQRWAAELSGDALSVALARWSRAGGFQAAREYGAGLRLLADARNELAEQVGAAPSPTAVTLLGSLRLREVTLASRARNEQATAHHLEQAERLAGQVHGGADRVHYHLTFGPVNTAVHEVAAQVELRHPEIAAGKARALRLPPSLPRTRRGHHHIDAARAFLAAGDREAALAALQQAREVAPQQTRYHPMAREAVRVLAGQYRKVGQDVRALAAWMGSAAAGAGR
ncbi:helix-turn-helix transcriptional regulator [Streptomyces sp. B1866]|uniref:helix-turn-helix transcriptional regulator n=1 Tax=Streptomyces sp. B1866 TaxID=3075431 RepID=UPI00289272C6|nr:helix-turn-helix transcriptional regulator [Streptomyces sp. B1866]MDT3398291.1 helix-turn-helix transcriptional regulator [Streptomyces sp. B1866]